ncbi:MAG: ABC transporter ATP-binding protein [Planctomycetota bacterium]
MSSVQLDQICKRLAGQDVLRNVNLEIESGEYVVLLGRSGTGKTTLLRLIAGLDHPDSGSIQIAGTPQGAKPPQRRDVAMMLQGDTLYPHLTVRQSIALPLRGNTPRDEIRLRVDEAAERVGIKQLLDRSPDQLSGGERRRAALAKVTLRQTSVRLLDEPLSGIDASLAHSLSWHLAQLQDEQGCTIHVTHDGREAMLLADRIAVLGEGRILQFDTAEKLYDDPVHRDVADALGSPPINWLHVGQIAAEVECVPEPLTSSFAPNVLDDSSDRQRICVGVRPERIRLTGVEAGTTAGLVMRGQVMHHSTMGEHSVTLVRVGDQWLSVVDRSATHLGPLTRNTNVKLSIETHDLLWFDPTSGQRIDEPEQVSAPR